MNEIEMTEIDWADAKAGDVVRGNGREWTVEDFSGILFAGDCQVERISGLGFTIHRHVPSPEEGRPRVWKGSRNRYDALTVDLDHLDKQWLPKQSQPVFVSEADPTPAFEALQTLRGLEEIECPFSTTPSSLGWPPHSPSCLVCNGTGKIWRKRDGLPIFTKETHPELYELGMQAQREIDSGETEPMDATSKREPVELEVKADDSSVIISFPAHLIATAPKDRVIYLFWGGCWTMGKWMPRDEGYWWVFDESVVKTEDPSHWADCLDLSPASRTAPQEAQKAEPTDTRPIPKSDSPAPGFEALNLEVEETIASYEYSGSTRYGEIRVSTSFCGSPVWVVNEDPEEIWNASAKALIAYLKARVETMDRYVGPNDEFRTVISVIRASVLDELSKEGS